MKRSLRNAANEPKRLGPTFAHHWGSTAPNVANARQTDAEAAATSAEFAIPSSPGRSSGLSGNRVDARVVRSFRSPDTDNQNTGDLPGWGVHKNAERDKED